MQALGSYRRGKMLFIGLGTGLGSTMIVDGIVEPMELGHLPYKKGTYESYLGNRALLKKGKKQWRRHVADVVVRLVAALEPDEVVLGGGNVKELKTLPPKCRAGDNRNAFRGGFQLWEASEPALSGTQLPSDSSKGKGTGNGHITSRSKLYASEGEAPGMEGPRSPLQEDPGRTSTRTFCE
jgi:predicted NBD/HSP70 family sugar kinase